MGLKETLEIAHKAIQYARKIISRSSTSPDLPSDEIAQLDSKIHEIRIANLSLEDNMRLALVSENQSTFFLKKTLKQQKMHHIGNCCEYADAALNYLRKQSSIPMIIEEVVALDGDHVFFVINRHPRSKIEDYTTWGDAAVVGDPWANKAYPAAEIPTQLNCFVYDSTHRKNRIYPVQPGATHFLVTHVIYQCDVLPLQIRKKMAEQKSKLGVLLYLSNTLKEQCALDAKALPSIKKIISDLQNALLNIEETTQNQLKKNASFAQLCRYYGKINRNFFRELLKILNFFDEKIKNDILEKGHGRLTSLLIRMEVAYGVKEEVYQATFNVDAANALLRNEIGRHQTNCPPWLNSKEIYLLSAAHITCYELLLHDPVLMNRLKTEHVHALKVRFSFLEAKGQTRITFFNAGDSQVLGSSGAIAATPHASPQSRQP